MDSDDALERKLAVQSLTLVGYARMVLNFCGVIYILLFLAIPFLTLAQTPGMTEDTTGMAIFAGVFLGSGCIGIVIGGLNLAAASLLGKGSKWGWYLGLVLGALYTPSLCLPFGALILAALLGQKSRDLYLKGILPDDI